MRHHDRTAFVDRASLGVRLIALLTVPAAFALFVLRRPLIALTLQHGNCEDLATVNTSRALAGFSLGLLGFSIYLFVLRGFYAHGDARTPFIINLVENLINIVLALVLFDRYDALGLGAAFAVAYLVCALWALQVMTWKVPGFPLRSTLSSIGRMVLAGLVMAESMWIVARGVGSNEGLGRGRTSRSRRCRRARGVRRRARRAARTRGGTAPDPVAAAPRRPPQLTRRACSSSRLAPCSTPSGSGGSTSRPRPTRASTIAPIRRSSSSRRSPRPRTSTAD